MAKKPILAGLLLILLLSPILAQNIAAETGYALQTGLGALATGAQGLAPAWDFLTDFTQTTWMIINEYSGILAGTEVKFNEYLIYNLFNVTKDDFESRCGVIKAKYESNELVNGQPPTPKTETTLGVFAVIGIAFLLMLVAGGGSAGGASRGFKAVFGILVGILVVVGLVGAFSPSTIPQEAMAIIFNLLTIVIYVFYFFGILTEGLSSESTWRLIVFAMLTILFVFALTSLIQSIQAPVQDVLVQTGSWGNILGAIMIGIGGFFAVVGGIGFAMQLVAVKRGRDDAPSRIEFLKLRRKDTSPINEKGVTKTTIESFLEEGEQQHKYLGKKAVGLPFLIVGLSLIFIGLAPLNTGETPLMKITPPNIVAVYYFAALITLVGVLTGIPQTNTIYYLQDKGKWALLVGITETLGIRKDIFEMTTQTQAEIDAKVNEIYTGSAKWMKRLLGGGIKFMMGMGGPKWDKDQVKNLNYDTDNKKNKEALKGLAKKLGVEGLEEKAGEDIWAMLHAPFAEIERAVAMFGWALVVLAIVGISAGVMGYMNNNNVLPDSLPCFILHVNLLALMLWSFFVVAAIVFIFNRANFSMMLLMPTPIYLTLQTLFGGRILGTIFKFALTLYLVILTIPSMANNWGMQSTLFYFQPFIAIIIFGLVKLISSLNYVLEVKSLKFMEGFLHKFFDKLTGLAGMLVDWDNTKFHKVIGFFCMAAGIVLLILGGANPQAGQDFAKLFSIIGGIAFFFIALYQGKLIQGGATDWGVLFAYSPSILPWIFCGVAAANPYTGLFPLMEGIIFLFVPQP